GVGLARGYHGKAALTAERFVPDPYGDGGRLYRTGDISRYRADGVIEYLGREDGQVKLRGFRIELGEIETVLKQHASVQACVVIAADVHGETCLLAYVTLTEAGKDTDTARLREFLRLALPEFMVPGAFIVLPEIPLSANGKVDRKALPSLEFEMTGGTFEPPENPVQQRIAAIWQQLLKHEAFGIHSDFFLVGGHSLLALRLVALLVDAFNTELSVEQIFDHATVARQASLLAQAEGQENGWPPIRTDVSSLAPLSFSQERLWFMNTLEAAQTVYHIPLAFHLRGALNISALEQALHGLAVRQPALRTGFVEQDGQLRQQLFESAADRLKVYTKAAVQKHGLGQILQAEIDSPFDLQHGRVFKAAVLWVDNAHSLLLLVIHHIVADGWSVDILLKELSGLYSRHLGGPQPAALPVSYADFCRWQRQLMTDGWFQAAEDYWLTHLQGAATHLELSYDKSRPALPSFRGAMQYAVIDADTRTALQTYATQQGATAFMTLLAVFGLVLYRYSGQSDFLVGTPMANRKRAEIHDVIGLFVNTVLMRIKPDPDQNFGHLLAAVRQTAIGAYQHQHYPFERLVEALQPVRDLAAMPLFQVMFVYQEQNSPVLALPGLSVEPVVLPSAVAKCDLSLYVGEQDGQWSLALEYSTDLFQEATVRQLLDVLVTVTTELAQDPHGPIGRIRLLSDAEQQRCLHDWNATDYDGDGFARENIPGLLTRQAQQTPDHPALIFNGATLSYGELECRANRLAHYLQKQG
ncbi:MAG: condensation domain-containing protein, partial [Aquabacterium sp.]|uniref:condensation domain-containing protein n=1 Tax=Aquabacterium sp. TaxID=1872578 RepID=UPI00271D15DA